MLAKYRIDICDTSGLRVATIFDYWSMTYNKIRNQPGELIFTVKGTHAALSLLTDNCILKVWRKESDTSAWVQDFTAIYRGNEQLIAKNKTFTAYCPGVLDLLNDRIVAYPPQSVNRSEFTSKPAETILNTLVKYNATSSGSTADGRVRLATIPNLSVAADSARGPTVAFWECAEKGLLDTMYELATQQKVAFQLVNTSGISFEWQYVVNTDVTTTQIFSIERGNVEQISFKQDRKAEKTVAIVGSTGDGTLKNYDVRTGANYNVTTNNREMYVNTGTDDLDEIYLEGDRELSTVQARNEIEFTILPTDSSKYKTHFDLHYLVTGRYNNVSYPLVVSEIVVSSDGSNPEKVTAKLEDV